MFARHRLRLLVITLLLGLAAALPGLVAAAPAGYTTTTVIPYLSGGYKYQVVAQGAGAGFEAPAFDDAAFATGAAAFGTPNPNCTLNSHTSDIHTPWPASTDILVRKSFTLPAGAKNLTVGYAIDNDIQVFLNGVDISGGLHTHEGCAGTGDPPFVAPDNLLIAGANVLAVRGRDRGSIDYLDVQVTVDEDTTAPSLAPTVTPNPVVLNGTATAVANATDSGSGVASQGCDPVDTSSVGAHTVACTATDVAGNTANANASYTVGYGVCALYDQAKSHKSGSTVPIKLQLCDANHANVSSAGVVVHATGLLNLDSSASASVDDSGAANSPDSDFRYDPTLGTTGGYIFNLSTKGLSTGTWQLSFTAGGATYTVTFDVR
jgi:hypothetical protein